MGSVNKVMLVGNLGKDAELRTTPGGHAVSSFSVATTEAWTDRDGAKQEKTEWVKCVLWGKTAEVLQPYLVKGKQVYVEGQLQTRQWEKDGQKHYATEVKAFRIVLLGGGKRDSDDRRQRDDDAAGPQANAAPVTDDDIPFAWILPLLLPAAGLLSGFVA